MKRDEFLKYLADEILQMDGSLKETDDLSCFEEWDSLAKMALMAWFTNSLKKKITVQEIKDIKTPAEIIKLAGGAIE